MLEASSPPNVPSPVNVTAGPGDEHGRAVEAMHQQCPQRFACLRFLTTEYSPPIVGARAQLMGHAVAIY